MSLQTHTEQLETARREYAAARASYDEQGKWNSRKRAASEALEFWGNKLAFLEAVAV